MILGRSGMIKGANLNRTFSVAQLSDPYAFQMAGFSPEDVDEILDDLDYLYQNSTWSYTRERTSGMIVESPVILTDFLRNVKADALRNAMIPRSVKNMMLR